MYQLLRRFLFLFPAEGVHYFAMNTFRLAGRAGLGGMLRNGFNAPADHPCDAFGLHFRNPVGLGAGFDKNALFLDELDTLGFGYVEIGTVTPLPQAGNDKPRLFRLPLDKALINRMGFNNDGVKVVAERVKAWRQKNNFPLAARAAHPGIIAQTDPSHPDSGFTKYDTHPNKESQTSNLKPQISNLK